MSGLSYKDPVFKSERITEEEVTHRASIPWSVSSPQTVNGSQCLVLELDGMRVRLVALKNAICIDGAEQSVDYVLFWIRS